MRVATFVLAGLVGLAAASPALAGNILYYDDGVSGTSAVPGAVALTPHTYSQYSYATASQFVAALNAGGVDLVIYGEQNNSSSWTACGAALTTYINGGGRVIGATWINSTSAFAALMQGQPVATFTGSATTIITTSSHAIFANCGATINVSQGSVGICGISYNPTNGATGIGTVGSASAVILGNSGRTLLNAPCMTAYPTISQGQQLIANEINYLITHTITGRVLYDRYVVDASGIGNTSQQNLALAGMRVEARNSVNATVGKAFTDDQGNFTLTVPGQTGTLVVCAENSVTALRGAAAGPPLYATFATGVSFNVDQNVGTFTLTEGVDPGGTARAPINAARAIKEAYDWAHARSTDAIPFLEVLYDTSAAPTSYTPKAGAVPATMRISGAAANPDGWDLDVIRKNYARHVLGSIAAEPGTPPSTTFDSVTAADNAFAEGFCYAFAALMSGSRSFFDGTGASTVSVLDLEAPTGVQSPKSPNCAAWVAQALFDLVDPANEAWDTVDGTGSAGESVFTLVDSLASPVTAAAFYSAWLAKGYDAAGITKDFLHHGLIPDDSDEPNDTPEEAAEIGQFGFVISNRTLNIANDDWYSFTLPEPTGAVTVLVSFNRVAYPSVTLLVQITSAAGSVLATGTAVDTTSPYKAVTGALPAGKYLLHLALASGGPLPSYSVQAYSKLTFRSDKFPPWTVGRPYSVSVNIVGGIPPYGLTIPSTYQGPHGLTLRGETGVIDGIPVGPPEGLAAGTSKEYTFLLNAVDGASPPNSASQLITFVLHDRVRSRFREFTTFSRGKAVDRAWTPVGGTPPYIVTVDQGALPDGLSIVDGDRLAFGGTPAAAGAFPFTMTTTDFAGSSATTSATAVVCVPVGPLALPAGKTAGGFYFDAVQGSSVGFTITTAKKQTLRTLRLAMYDVDGYGTLNITPKLRPGKASFTKFIAPSTGRFYCVVAGDDALGATSLNCAAKTKLPVAGKGDAGTFSFGGADAFSLPVGILNGGTLTFTVKPDRKSGLRLKVLALKNPAGQSVTLADTDVKVVAKTGMLTLKKVVDVSGTWTVVLGADTGPRGTFTYTYKLKQPKGGVYSEE